MIYHSDRFEVIPFAFENEGNKIIYYVAED